MQVVHGLASEKPVIEKHSDLDHLGIKLCLMSSFINFFPGDGDRCQIVVYYKHKYILKLYMSLLGS